MKYSTVKITPDLDRRKWVVEFNDIEGDRVMRVTQPADLGYYHYPTALGRREAFRRLVTRMIRRHETEIRQLTRSAAALRELKYPSEREKGGGK